MGLLDSFMEGVQSSIAGQAASSPQAVAQAYGLMNQQLQQDRKDDEAQYYENLIRAQGSGNTSLAPEDVAAARAKPAKELQAYQGPTALERWKQQVDALVASGNPVLQEQGMDMMQAYHQRATQVPTADKDVRTTGAKYADELGLQGKPRMDFIRNFAMKQPFASPGDTPYSINELKGLEVPDGKGGWKKPEPGFTPNMARTQGARLASTQTAGDAGKLVMMTSALEQLPIIKEMLYTPEGNIDRDVMNLSYLFTKDPTANAIASKFIAQASGKFTPEQIERAKRLQTALETGIQAITRTETGAEMPQEEIDNTRTRFMPAAGDPESVVKQKMRAYEYFLTNAIDMIDPTVRKGNDPAALSKEVQRVADESLKKFKVGTEAGAKYNPTLTPEEQGFTRVQ